MSDYASESGHWYKPDGSPCYTIRGKNGRERNTTLRDARTMNLFPSVTTVTGQAAAPALELWKIKQAVLAALTLPRVEGESSEMLVERILTDSRTEAKAAADRGTLIHGAIEQKMLHQAPAADLVPFADAAMLALDDRFPGATWSMEKSFASPIGFGGKVDLHSMAGFGSPDGIVVDYKTKDISAMQNVKCYDNHFMQIAAYRAGLGIPNARGANMFVARQRGPFDPVSVVLIEHDPEDLARGWRMFEALLAYFYARTGLVQVPA
jgi:hypothetical protein